MSSISDRPAKRQRTTEDVVVGEVWRELGGLLCEQFAVPSDRVRYLDALIVESSERQLVSRANMPRLENRRVWAIEVKSGTVDAGVLGQALFGAQLVRRVHPEAHVIPFAAAPGPAAAPLQQLLTEFHPDGIAWKAYPAAARAGTTQRSSGAPDPVMVREPMLDWYAKDNPGTMIKVGERRHRLDFQGVRIPGTTLSLTSLGLSALLLRERPTRVIDARSAEITLELSEAIEFVFTSTDLYRTQMGQALFSAELARRILRLSDAVGVALYQRDNEILRQLLSQYDAARAVQHVHWTRAETG